MGFSGSFLFPFGGSTSGLSPIAAPNGRTTLPGGIIDMWGSITVPADGSASITVPTGFPTACFQPLAQIDQEAVIPDYTLTTNVRAVTQANFQITVTGGPPGSTTLVRWRATGN